MIDKIIAISVRKPFLIAFFTLVLMFWGSFSLYNLPIDAVPDVTSNQVDVITLSQNLASLEIEQFITAPIEMAMSNIPGLIEIRSISKFGLSVVKLVFSDDTDVYWARQQVFERLEAVKNDVPEELGKPIMGPVSTGLGEVFQYVIRAKDPKDKSFSPMEIRTLQDWVIRKQLLGTPGIAEVSGFGGYNKEYQAEMNPDRMRSLHVTIDELFAALSEGNANTGGAYIEKNNKAFTIRGIGLASSLEEIGNTVIKINNRVPVLIKDVAEVKFGSSIRYGAISMNGTGEVVAGIVMMLKGENGLAVIKRIKDKMVEIQKSLPEGLVIEPFIDREKLVSKAISTVITNLLEGALIVVLVILVFLGNWRASLLAASVIPLAMLFAFICMRQFGLVGSLMSLGAIDFGLLVDPAIIVVESVVLYLATAMSKRTAEMGEMTYADRQEVIIAASQEVKKSVVFGGLIILIVYFPLMTLEGIEGKMFIPMAKTVSFAITGALLLAVTYIPMMSAVILRPPKSLHHGGISDVIVNFLYRIYEPVLKFGLRKKYSMVILAFLVLIGGGFGFSVIGGEFIPKLAEGDLNIEINLPVGSSLTESLKLAQKIQTDLLREFPDEVEKAVSRIGTAEVPLDPKPLESQEMVVVLADRSKWKKTDNQWELIEQIDSVVFKKYPGLVVSIQQPIENRVNELMSGAKSDVVVKVFGTNLDTVVAKGQQITNIIAGIQGVTDIVETKVFGLPQINIKYNREQMAFYGITVSQINRALQTAFAGAKAGLIYENDKRFDLTMRLATEDRNKSENISNLLIEDKDGHPIPLSELAEISENVGPTEIQHENLQRKINIGFNVRGRDMESLVNEAMQKVGAQVVLPKGYAIDFGGQFENLKKAKARLGLVVPIALLIIFGLLYTTFGSINDSVLIYTVVPLSAVGGVFSLLLRGLNFSISAGVGFIALFGIAVLNGILLVGQFKYLANNGISNPNRQVLQGIRERFRPVLMTSAVAALGFLPMALSSSAGAEVQRPLATVVIGGLFTATLLTLLVLPILYTLFNKRKTEMETEEQSGLMPKKALATLILLLLSAFAFAQNKTISLNEATETALKNNPEMLLAGQKIDQQRSLLPAAYNVSNLEIVYEAPTGTEQRMGVMQKIDYPGIYSAQRNAQDNRIQVSETERKITRNSLFYRTRTIFNQVQFFIEKVELLTRQDSAYSNILAINEVRYNVGQISNLEKVNGESQYKRIQYNLAQAKSELRNAKIQMGLLLGSPGDTSFLPDLKLHRLEELIPEPAAFDNAFFLTNPMLALNKNYENLNQSILKVEKRKLSPSLIVGWLDQGNTETSAFYRLKFGVSIPIWAWTYKANINSAKKGVEISQTQTKITTYQLGTEYAKAMSDYRQNKDNLAYFEGTAVRQANEILRDSRESYRLGSISYYAYLQNLELAFQIQLNYLESMSRYNQAIINLKYLKGEE